MKITKRIKKILEYINIEDNVADIGCDHGYLCLGCIEKGVSFVQNIDNKEGPLNMAKRNLEKYNSKGQIIYTLCDGLNCIDERVDTIVISGMGGDLITQIVNTNLNKAKKLKKIIVVAHSKVFGLREKLTKHFVIIDEDLVEDKDKIYEIIVFAPQNNVQYGEKELMFGPVLCAKKSQLFIKKIERRLNEINKILSSTTNDALFELIKEKKYIEELLVK